MKTLKPGLKQWWDGLRVICHACQWEGQLEQHDRPVRSSASIAGHGVTCPNCGRRVPVHKPDIPIDREPGIR